MKLDEGLARLLGNTSRQPVYSNEIGSQRPRDLRPWAIRHFLNSLERAELPDEPERLTEVPPPTHLDER